MDTRTELIPKNGHGAEIGPSHRQMIEQAKGNIAEVLRSSTLAVREVLSEVKDVIANCEAEVELNEKINVIFEPDKAIFSVERNFRFAKDKT